MKISCRARYAVRIMVDLAEQHYAGEKNNVKLKDIAERQEISRDYLVHLVLELKNAQLVRSFSGKGGGHTLARLPEQINMLEIVEAAIGPLNIMECLNDEKYCTRVASCRSRNLWKLVNESIRRILGDITLDRVVKDGYDIELLAGGMNTACTEG
jgi:Rrf2 family protein